MKHIIDFLETSASVRENENNPRKQILENYAFAFYELSTGMNSGDLLNWSDISKLADRLVEIASEEA